MNMKPVPPIYNQCLLDTGKGPVVLLLHGLFDNLMHWNSTVNALKSNYRVIIPRLPLFKDAASGERLTSLVKALSEFVAWHQLSDVTLVGHGVGGQLALMYAYTHPDKVARLVLSGSFGLYDPVGVNTPDEREELAVAEKNTDEDYFTEEAYLAVQHIPKRLTLSVHTQRLSAGLGLPFLNKIEQRTLLLWGVNDAVTPPEIALHFHDFLKNSELIFLKNCGHEAMSDQPDEFSHHVYSFLNA